MKLTLLRYQTATFRAIPMLLLIWTATSFTVAAEPHKIPKSISSAEPAANGDWTEAFFDAAHTGNNRYETLLNRDNVGNLTQLWASPVGSGLLFTSPVVSNGKVYIGSGDGQMYALDALTGATLWVGAQQPVFFSKFCSRGSRASLCVGVDRPTHRV